MPIPLNHIQERLSVAYVSAIVARAGANFMQLNGSEYGIDGTIQHVRKLPNGKFTNTGWHFDCQLKATIDWIERPDAIVYDLDVDAYNKLVGWEGSLCILVLFRMPKNEDEWLYVNEQSLLLRNCCYWKRLRGQTSTNSRSVRIEIPRVNLFTPDTVNSLLTQLSVNSGEVI